jgi:hypothetical protein
MEDKEQGTGSYRSWKAPRSHAITTMEPELAKFTMAPSLVVLEILEDSSSN